MEAILEKINQMSYSELEKLKNVIADREARLDKYNDWGREQMEWDRETAEEYEYPQF